jgi:hypothetical protein
VLKTGQFFRLVSRLRSLQAMVEKTVPPALLCPDLLAFRVILLPAPW